MKKKRMALKGYAGVKTAKYLFRHPIRGTRNLLALRGLKSLVMTRRAAYVGAVAVSTAVAMPLAIRAARNSER